MNRIEFFAKTVFFLKKNERERDKSTCSLLNSIWNTVLSILLSFQKKGKYGRVQPFHVGSPTIFVCLFEMSSFFEKKRADWFITYRRWWFHQRSQEPNLSDYCAPYVH